MQKLGIGGVLAAVAFVISAIVELQLEDTYAVLPEAGQAQLRIFNGLNCRVQIDISGVDASTIEPLSFWQAPTLSVNGANTYMINVNSDSTCEEYPAFQGSVEVTEEQATSYFITYDEKNSTTVIPLGTSSSPFDTIDKSKSGNPLLRVIYNFKDRQSNRTLRFQEVDSTETINYRLDSTSYTTETEEIPPAIYHVSLAGDNGTIIADQDLQLGGVYTLIVQENNNGIDVNLLTITQPNSIHMLWLIPQYFVMTMGEVMFSITGLEFSFTQAPVSMKSVLQAGWLLTVAFGNLIVVIIAEAKFFNSQAYEFFLFAGLMLVDMGIFAFMALKYKYVENPEEEDDEEENKINGLALKEANSSERNGIQNSTFKNDEEG